MFFKNGFKFSGWTRPQSLELSVVNISRAASEDQWGDFGAFLVVYPAAYAEPQTLKSEQP